MNPNPIRRSPSPLAPPQQPAQFIYATPSPTTTSPYQLTGSSPFMATTNGGSDVTAGADGRPLYLCQPFIRAALVTGKFKNIVVLPKYVDVNEWVAINSHFNSLFAHFLAFGKEFEILDPRDIRGLGIGDLADRWKEMGILES
ncbi:Maintenance of ploidy protein mob2 [Tulasnella sp. 425]|nr:Maintenance of ploidy protein mob2 [Tulasnella sp. 425]